MSTLSNPWLQEKEIVALKMWKILISSCLDLKEQSHEGRHLPNTVSSRSFLALPSDGKGFSQETVECIRSSPMESSVTWIKLNNNQLTTDNNISNIHQCHDTKVGVNIKLSTH